MTTFIVSFRLNYDSTYSDRRDSVIKAIREKVGAGSTWEEMTSLIIFQSSMTADEVASVIYYGSTISPFSDALLVIDLTNGTYATKGKFDYPVTLASLLVSNALAKLAPA